VLLKPIKTVHIKLSNHWHFLVLGAFVSIVSRRPDVLFNPQFWAEDGAVRYAGVILIAGLSGPLSTLLVPIAAIQWYVGREKWLFFLFLELCTCAMVQGAAIFFTAQATLSNVLG